MKFIGVVLVVLMSLSHSHGHAQANADVQVWSAEFKKLTDDLDIVEDNLRTMGNSPGLSGEQFVDICVASKYLMRFSVLASGLLQVSYIYTAMIDPRDAAYVRKHLNLSCDNLKANGQVVRSIFNELLPKMSSSAIRNEVTRARDIIAKINMNLFCK
jgi:hypothetical protein